MQWIESLRYGVDIEKLQAALEDVKKVGPMVFQGEEFGFNKFGGWNLQSRTGDYRDGFQWGVEKCYRKVWKPGTFNYHLAKFLNYSMPFEHKNKTNACIGPFNDVLDFLESKGFYPRRLRITCLKPHSRSIIHSDASPDKYLARIHIPLITNEKCIHWTEYGEAHMPADGSLFMLWVNCMHQIRNDSDEERYHLFCDAYDTKGVTENFKYTDNINKLIEEAEAYRKHLDSIHVNFFRKVIYSIGREVYVAKFKMEQKMIEASYKLNDKPQYA